MVTIYVDLYESETCLLYAAALASATNGRLKVFLANKEEGVKDESRADATEAVLDDVQDSIAWFLEHNNYAIDFEVVDKPNVTEANPNNSWLVSNKYSESVLPVWRPASETGFRDPHAPILVPFGNDPNVEYAYAWAVTVAKLLRREIVFYHTTWPKKGVNSKDPKDHWDTGAKTVARIASKLAEVASVSYTVQVESAESIDSGIHRAALAVRAACIVMQPDPTVVAGSYTDQLIARPHLVPLVILPRREMTHEHPSQ